MNKTETPTPSLAVLLLFSTPGKYFFQMEVTKKRWAPTSGVLTTGRSPLQLEMTQLHERRYQTCSIDIIANDLPGKRERPSPIFRKKEAGKDDNDNPIYISLIPTGEPTEEGWQPSVEMWTQRIIRPQMTSYTYHVRTKRSGLVKSYKPPVDAKIVGFCLESEEDFHPCCVTWGEVLEYLNRCKGNKTGTLNTGDYVWMNDKWVLAKKALAELNDPAEDELE